MTQSGEKQAAPSGEVSSAPKKNRSGALTQNHGSAPFAVILFVIGVIAELYACLVATRGVLCYTVDDAYVHMALAEHVAHGTYGLNLHEFSAPSSSILWPFLLLIGVGTSWHLYVPLALNIVFGSMAAWLIGKCVDESPWENGGPSWRLKRMLTVLLFVVGLNLIGLAFMGMEHMLQLLLAAACAYGILQVHRGREMPRWSIAAACAGPAVRYENLAILIAVALVLYWDDRKRAAIWAMLAGLAMPLMFSVFLLAHGSSVLPNSVLMKGTHGGGWKGLLANILLNLIHNVTENTRLSWLVVFLAAAELWWLNRRSRPSAVAAVAIVLGLVLVFGKVGNYRYESFAVAFTVLILFVVLGGQYRVQWHLAMLGFLLCTWPYFRYVAQTPVASQNIYQQQYQMARFVRDYYKKNFAVNDIGVVSYRLPQNIYILDTAGLASPESFMQQNKNAEWADSFTRRHNAGLAMIYTDWLQGIPPAWSLLGRLVLGSELVAPAEDHVDIYATSVGDSAEIDAELRAFQKTLPPRTTLLLRQQKVTH